MRAPKPVREMNIRLATSYDEDAIWSIFHAVIATGDTYVFDPHISREDALAYWFRSDIRTYVIEDNGWVVGTYILQPNQPALGSHVANAAFMVILSARGLGVGRSIAEHCLNEARRLGYVAMQFNFVASTNRVAVRLWRQFDFTIVGTLPGAFRHPTPGLVDAYVMFRHLRDA